ncbi:MAG: radical SAM protein [Desulfobacteraceae bacterium]|nr:radical SAM protein [Desulfobacteraceae bacterium]
MDDVKQFSSDKILKHLDRVNAWLAGENPFPITVELDMTNICNHRCPECAGSYNQKKNNASLSLEMAAGIIEQLAEAEIRGLIFTGGGEPLCNPATSNTVKLAYVLDMDIGFITKGSLINEQNAEALAGCCKWVRVSLDAICRHGFRRVHGVDSFEKVVDGIRLLVEAEGKATIGVGYLTDESDSLSDSLYDVAEFCKELGVDYLQFRPMQEHKNGKIEYHQAGVKEQILKCQDLSDDKYQVLYSKHKYDRMDDKDYGRCYGKCLGQQFATVIGADGLVYLCCHFRGFDKYCLGNLKASSFKDIWNSQKRQEVINNIDFNDCVPLCRCNTFNQILWNIKQPREHVNFL